MSSFLCDRPQNRQHGAYNKNTRYGAQEVRTWRAMRADGYTYDAMNILTGVSKGVIHDAITRKTWAWLDKEEA